MSATVAPPVVAPQAAEPVARRRLRPVMFLALLGGLFLALMAYEWGSSAADGDLHATTAGRSSEPTWAKVSVHGQEIALGLLALVVIWLFVIRPWRRERTLTS